MARLIKRPRSRGLGKRAWIVTWSIRLVLWTLGFTRIVRTVLVHADVVPKKGAVLLAANHTSMIDVLFLLAALRRPAIAMAMAELWKSPLTRWLVEVLGQIPVVRGDPESGKQAMDSAAHALADGALVGIFPEQKIVKPGDVAPYRPGVAVLSKRTNVPIIPVRLVNADLVLPLDKTWPSLGHTVYVLFGEPIDPKDFATVDDLLAETQRRITTLEPPAGRKRLAAGMPVPPHRPKEHLVSTPDHAENTGDNLRHAAEVQQQAQDGETDTAEPDAKTTSAPPDFNT